MTIAWTIIPARLHSTRLPRKLLLDETGMPLIQHTYEAVCDAKLPFLTYVATEDEEISFAVRKFGGKCITTSAGIPNGSSRCAEAVRLLEGAQVAKPDVIVNVQGDEPEIRGEWIDKLVQAMHDNPSVDVATLVHRLESWEEVEDPNQVKVVVNRWGRAMWFSRAVIPYRRMKQTTPKYYLGHIGIYAFRRNALMRYAVAPSMHAELTEELEQLRMLNENMYVYACLVQGSSRGIDTAEDYSSFVAKCRDQ